MARAANGVQVPPLWGRLGVVKRKLLEYGGELNVKRLAKSENIAIVGLIWRIRGMTSDLEFSGLTLDRLIGYGSSTFEPTHLEWQPRWTVHPDPVTIYHRLAEVDYAHVDEASTPVDEHPVEIVVHTIGRKARRFHGRCIGVALYGRDGYVQVLVLARLTTEKRIDPPPAI